METEDLLLIASREEGADHCDPAHSGLKGEFFTGIPHRVCCNN